MRSLWFIPFLFVTAIANANICGLYQVEDYRDQVVTTLTDFRSQRPMTLNFRITNSDSQTVGSMVNSVCYCVKGTISPDPAYPNDPLYKLLEVEAITGPPYSDCGPTP